MSSSGLILPVAPPVAFLGLSDRVNPRILGRMPFLAYDILALRTLVPLPFFPAPISSLFAVLAVYSTSMSSAPRVVIRDPDGAEFFTTDMSFKKAEPEEVRRRALAPVDTGQDTQTAILPVPSEGPYWQLFFFPFGQIVINKEGVYSAFLQRDEGDVPIGDFKIVLERPVPLTDDRILAIKSDPSAMKKVRIVMGCNHCGKGIKAYAALERKAAGDETEYTWYQDLPDHFRCDCGVLDEDISTMRANLHALLGRRIYTSDDAIIIERYYDEGVLSGLLGSFRSLLDDGPPEEEVQKFIDKNTIIFHIFAPQRFFIKPKILAKYVADYGIITANGDLLLVEIEKPATQLLKKGGGMSAQLQTPFDQVRNWRSVVDEHRSAVLDGMGLNSQDVGAVKYVVIAGRETGCDEKQLKSLKSTDFGVVDFFTYDDLLRALESLGNRIGTV